MFKRAALLLLVAFSASFLVSCAQPKPAPAPETKAVRIAVATFSHETCTFCPEPTGDRRVGVLRTSGRR